MKWKYTPSPMADSVETAEEFINLPLFGRYEDEKSNFKNCLSSFFQSSKIQGFVNKNNWEEIINAWEEDYWNYIYKTGVFYGNKVGWSTINLTDFLYLLKIDFWNYLSDNFNPENCNLNNYLEKENE